MKVFFNAWLRRNGLAFGIAVVFVAPIPVHAQIFWDISVKFILGPPSPAGIRKLPGSLNDPNCTNQNCSAVSCRAEVMEKIDYGNEVLDALGRGYRMRVIEFVNIVLPEPTFSCCDDNGTTCSSSSDCTNGTCNPISSWFNAPSRPCTWTALDVGTKNDPAAFGWNSNAINIYVTNRCQGGFAGRAPGGVIVIGQAEGGAMVRWLHEIGHHFSLCHTHGPGCPGCSGADDCLSDTIEDADAWDDPDDIAQGTFSLDYNDPALTCAERSEVRDVLYNIMSYHQDHQTLIQCDPTQHDVDCATTPPPNLCRHILTPDQLDLMTDLSNTLRRGSTSGCTHFVDARASFNDLRGIDACNTPVGMCDILGDGVFGACCDLDGDGRIDDFCRGPAPRPRPDLDGNSTRPYPTVASALSNASAGDILMIRGGFYNEQLTINQPVYLRGSRGSATIGR